MNNCNVLMALQLIITKNISQIAINRCEINLKFEL
jgi:hypothetical protein